MTKERRRTTRIEIVQHVGGVIVPLSVHLRVKEMSLGGMLIQTNAELPPLGDHDFRLQLSNGVSTLVRGRIVHGHFAVSDDGVMYTLGIAFSLVPADSAAVIRRFILETRADPFPTRPPSYLGS